MSNQLCSLCYLFVCSLFSISFAQEWTNITGLGTSATVFSLFSFGNYIYVGGQFNFIGSNNIARFDTVTESFTRVANGTTGNARAFCVRGSELFIGAVEINPGLYLGRVNLNTNQWISIPPGGPNSTVYAMTMIGSDIIVGGRFTGPYSRIMKFTANNTWLPLDSTVFDDWIRSFVLVNSILYVVGHFESPCSHFASWNGVNWECPNNSTLIDNDVYSFASNSVGNEFILGGYFTSPQLYALKASNFNNSTSFNYTSPSISSSNELNGSVYAVLSVGDDFYLGGFFSSIAHWVVKLSNGVYSNISSSTIDSTARVLLKHEGYLYAGGNQNYGFSRIAIFPTPPPTPGPPTTTSEPSQSSASSLSVRVIYLSMFVVMTVVFLTK